VTGPDVVAAYTHNVLRVAAHLVELRPAPAHRHARARARALLLPRDHGRDRRLLRSAPLHGPSARTLAALARIPVSEAHVALRRHLGVVFDTCHLSLEYEDMAESLEKLVGAGVPIFKLQEAAALKVPESPPRRSRC